MKDFGFYLVMTNPVVGYAKCAEAAVRAGVKIVQLRMKHASREEILREAREVRRATAGTDTLFIVNDDPALAAEAEADGVHVGQDDMPPAEVRARFPQLRVVGLSTHNLAQVRASTAQPIDYIGVGPVNYMQMILLGKTVIRSVKEHSLPVIIVCRYRCTECDRYFFKSELIGQLFCYGFIAFSV